VDDFINQISHFGSGVLKCQYFQTVEMSSAFRGTYGVCCPDVDQSDLVRVVGQFLKKQGKITMPNGHEFAKTSSAKEQTPEDPDWYYYKLASMLRRLNYRKHIGVGGFRKVYSTRKNNGCAREHTALGNQGIIRRGLQALEKLGYVAKHEDGGRVLSSEGRKVLDRMAVQIGKEPYTKE
jgi:small subunit ribosomal protein S19e